MDQGAQPRERLCPAVFEDTTQQTGRLLPFVGLQPKQDRRLVREYW